MSPVCQTPPVGSPGFLVCHPQPPLVLHAESSTPLAGLRSSFKVKSQAFRPPTPCCSQVPSFGSGNWQSASTLQVRPWLSVQRLQLTEAASPSVHGMTAGSPTQVSNAGQLALVTQTVAVVMLQ